MKKKKLLRILFVVLEIMVNLIVFWKVDFTDVVPGKVDFVVEMSADKENEYQAYYAKAGASFDEKNSSKVLYMGGGKEAKLLFETPLDFDTLRLDLGDKADSINITAAYILLDTSVDVFAGTPSEDVRYDIPLSELAAEESAVGISDKELSSDGQTLTVVSESGDPNTLIPYHKDELLAKYDTANSKKTLITDVVICAVIDLIAVYVLLHFFSLIDIPVEIYQNRRLALNLARNDFKTKYAGSYLGMVWAFIQPVVTIAVYWFVFTVGFRAGSQAGYPFVLFIVSGIIPWFFFSDALNGGTNAMTDYNYLVKKVVFNIDILPFVKVVSALFVHCFFIVFALILATCMGYYPSVYTVQLIYYIVCNIVFVLGLSYLSSAIVVFFRDLGQFINIFVLQVGVWLTPIMWHADSMLSPSVHKFFKLNPMYYIVSGFRDSIVEKHWFWQGERLLWTIYFWTITLLVFGLGVKIFRRLKVHFADVL